MLIRFLSLAAMAAVLGAGPVCAGDPPPFKDFTFKRVKPPEPGAKKRITVQIAPKPPEPAAPKEKKRTKPQGDAPSAPELAGWFWDDLPGAGLDRLETALRRVERGGAIRVPRLQELRPIADRHGAAILKATVGTRVSPALALAVISVESGGRRRAVSSAGAQGLMQLMPATAARFDVADSGVAAENIRGGVAYLDWLLAEFGEDPLLALAGYNAGENAVKRHGGPPPYAETRAYVPKVLAAWKAARGLCVTPPQLMSDGCVFIGSAAGQG
ncbi:lytic transglycosylase domain-containing protein [Tranquillimonas rosea]|uniref:lytic transglycosylase domain-containing protein n=1 Tax=Tranquillimonas rosea TaxID=641238 RepID=UPI003BAB0B3C